MHHKPMTYLTRHFEIGYGIYKYSVFFCNKHGERATATFDTPGAFFAFIDALAALGFKKKRR